MDALTLAAQGFRREPSNPDLRLTEVKAFGSNPGALRMWIYAPKILKPSPALVVVLHGCTQSAAGYIHGAGWAGSADERGFVVLAPEQQKTNNQKSCFTWFEPGDTARDKGEAFSIRQMIEKAVHDHNVDRSRIFVTGLSAGGAMTAVMLAAYPELFAGGAIVGGLPYGAAMNVQQAFESMFQVRNRSAEEWGNLVRGASAHEGAWPRISIWHGSGDRTVQPGNGEELVKQWTNIHGFPEVPTAEGWIDGAKRRVWRKDGADWIEHYNIPNMGHGTPVNTRPGRPRGGQAGPFFLDTGIHSTFYIAQFWGLGNDPAHSSKRPEDALELLLEPEGDADAHLEERLGFSIESVARNEGGTSWTDLAKTGNVEAIVKKALRTAGLIRS
jgi:feruloyl esterase